jgi:acylphosphatase
VIRRRVVVRGRVQGVFFRDTCRREARSRGVSGWAANRADGSVEVVFEGEADAVDQMLAWCRTGPEEASVASVEVEVEQPQQESGFRVR